MNFWMDLISLWKRSNRRTTTSEFGPGVDNPELIPDISVWYEINCPNCGMISFIGTIREGEEREFHCEAGEASCGWTWSQKFKFDNVHDYDVENFRNGHWRKTNWGGKDKNKVIEYAKQVANSFANRIGSLGKKTDGVRVVDKENNILFEWIRNENNTEN